MQILQGAYRNKRVLLTGHTGFKGAWLTQWLQHLGADVTGYSLVPPTTPSLFEAAMLSSCCNHIEGDIRDSERLQGVVKTVRPHYVFHLAAQSVVRRSYEVPLETFEVNVLGTAHVLEALRSVDGPCAIVVVTSDKCYENREWPYGYRESDPMGGHDPYSASKGATELVVSSYRRSFFPPQALRTHGIAIATARAGNVLGGGDWTPDGLIPDMVRALSAGEPVWIRNPGAVRPWQHVLEPLSGYLLLGARLGAAPGNDRHDSAAFCDAWNFGPTPDQYASVEDLVNRFISLWGSGMWRTAASDTEPHESNVLRLSIDKTAAGLGWLPRWRLDTALSLCVEWYRQFYSGASVADLRAMCRAQITEYETAVPECAATLNGALKQ